jgi:predicted DCC family thiol-disulfide oxidoreductase YuxK
VKETAAIVLFDGVCNLCDSFVRFILERDRAEKFVFASLQSEAGRKCLREHRLPEGEITSVVLIQAGRAFTRSGAAVRILGQLPGAWFAARSLLLIPGPLRNGVYDWIARHRYRWFGKQDQCLMPRPEFTRRFLS